MRREEWTQRAKILVPGLHGVVEMYQVRAAKRNMHSLVELPYLLSVQRSSRGAFVSPKTLPSWLRQCEVEEWSRYAGTGCLVDR